MSTIAQKSWLGQVLRQLPASWLQALDGWSYRVALKNRERRRQLAQRSRPVQPVDS